MEIDLNKITEQIRSGLTELLNQANLHEGDLVVLGCSTSEIQGEHIGKYPSVDVGRTVVSAVMEVLKPRKLYLAVQGCEHLNRALVVERKIAEEKNFEIVTVFQANMPADLAKSPHSSKWTIPLKLNTSSRRQEWTSEIRQSACT